jgi:hypothetical protein
MSVDLAVRMVLNANKALQTLDSVKEKLAGVEKGQEGLAQNAKAWEESVKGANSQVEKQTGKLRGAFDVAVKIAKAYTQFRLVKSIAQSETFAKTIGNIAKETDGVGFALDLIPKAFDKAKAAATNAAGGIANAANTTKNLAQTSVNVGTTLIQWLPTIAKVATGIGVAALAMWGLKKATDAAFARFDEIQRQRVFGVDEKQIAAVREALGDVYTRAEAANVALQFRQAGIPPALIADTARLADTISKLTGITKEQAVEQVRTGQISEETMRALGVSAAQLENAYQRAQGASQRPLEGAEKLRIQISLLSRSAKGLEGDLKTAFPSNPFKVFATQFRALGQDLRDFIARDLGPAIIAFAKGITAVLRGVITVLRGVVSGIRWLGQTVGIFAKNATDATKAADKLRGALEKNDQQHRKNAEAAQRNTIEVQRYRASVQAAIEAQRLALRVTSTGLEAQAGALSPVLSAGTQAVDTVTQLAVVYGKFFEAAATKTPQFLKGLREQGKINDAQLRGYLAINQAINTAAVLQAETLKVQTRQVFAARAILGETEQVAKVAAIELERYTQQERAKASIALQQRRINLLQEEAAQLVVRAISTQSKAQQANLFAQARIIQQQVTVSEAALRVYRAQAIELDKQLRVQEQMAKIERDFAAIRQRVENTRKVQDAELAIREVQRETLAAQNKLTEEAKIRLDLSKTELGLQRQIEDALTRQREVARLLAEPNAAQGQRRSALEAEASVLQKQIYLLNKQREAQRDLASERIQSLSVFGQLQDQFAAKVLAFNADLATSLKGAIDGSVGAVGNAISSLFQGLVTGQKNLGEAIGAGILDALAGVAAQMGSFLILAGTGLTASLIPTGPAAIAAGVGLLALAGTLKGIGANITKTPKTTASFERPQRDSLPGQQVPQREERNTYILVTSSMFGPPEQQARQVRRFFEENNRPLGRVLR